MQILILAGGRSPEREVSLVSGECVRAALAARHRVTLLDLAAGLPARAALEAADAVFLALHGGAGEDGTLQRELEWLGIRHYTGSPPDASALAMHKARAKAAVRAAGVPIASGGVLPAGERPRLSAPVVCKPLCGGSSIGLLLAKTPEQLPQEPFPESMLTEELLPGREYSVGLLAGEPLPVVELRPRGGAYDYAHKYTHGATQELCPAPIPASYAAQLQALACRSAIALGIRDYARVDFKERAAGEPVFLEANTLPGMTGESLLPLAAQAAGIPFCTLCETMAALAAARHR